MRKSLLLQLQGWHWWPYHSCLGTVGPLEDCLASVRNFWVLVLLRENTGTNIAHVINALKVLWVVKLVMVHIGWVVALLLASALRSRDYLVVLAQLRVVRGENGWIVYLLVVPWPAGTTSLLHWQVWLRLWRWTRSAILAAEDTRNIGCSCLL
jgi:hypothetical protein